MLRSGNALHRRVIDDHVVGFESRVVLRNFLERIPEQSVGQLHNIRLMNAGNLLPVVRQRKRKCELRDSLGLCAGNDFQGFDNAGNGLVLKAGVFTFGVFTDDAEVYTLVSGFVTGDVLDKHDGGVDVEFLAESDIERLVP